MDKDKTQDTNASPEKLDTEELEQTTGGGSPYVLRPKKPSHGHILSMFHISPQHPTKVPTPA